MNKMDQPATQSDIEYMKIALQEAQLAQLEGEVPIGACVVNEGRIIARAHNRRESDNSPSAHAEFLAMQRASEVLGRWRLSGCTVYVTLEPCVMCAGMMINSRVDRCVFGSYDRKGGALGTLYSIQSDERLNHSFEVVGGVMEDECTAVLKNFFSLRRKERKQAKEDGVFIKPLLSENDRLEQARVQINQIDEKMFDLLNQRLDASYLVAQYKLDNGLDVLDQDREDEKIEWAGTLVDGPRSSLYKQFMKDLMTISKEYQHLIIDEGNDSIQEKQLT